MFTLITHLLHKARKFIWVYKQPLTNIPLHLGDPVSDLFVWRKGKDWETYFDLIDIYDVFADDSSFIRHIVIIFFDANGVQLVKKKIDLIPKKRHTLNLNEMIPSTEHEYGTFCVFHSHTPDIVNNLGSYIAERGYVCFRYKNSPLTSYVHGNLDAVTYDRNKEIQLLSSTSFLTREYRLQYELMDASTYDIAVVNTSDTKQSINCLVINSQGDTIKTLHYDVPTKGAAVFNINLEYSGNYRVVIKSKLIMARPLVYCINSLSMNVFHG